jgi:hypothetical protein
MKHRSKSNFKGFFNGYPYAFNVVEEASSENNVEDVNDAAYEQINSLLYDSLPFDPEELKFKPSSDQMVYTNSSGDTFSRSKKTYGYWKFCIFEKPESEMVLYIPNILIAHIVLTSIGVLERCDINKHDMCPNNLENSGVCAACESGKKCNFER